MPKTKNSAAETQPTQHAIVTLRGRLYIPEEIRNMLPESDDTDCIDLEKLTIEVVKKVEILLTNGIDSFLRNINTVEGSPVKKAQANEDLPDDIQSNNEPEKQNEAESNEEDGAAKIIFECLTCLRHLLESKKDCLPLLQVRFKVKLHSIIRDPSFDFKMKNAAALVSEKIIAESIDFDRDDDGDWALQLYLWLLSTVEGSEVKGSAPFVKRVAAMGKVALKRGLALPSVPLLRCVTDERYLAIKEGRQLIASLFSHSSLLAAAHARFIEALPNLPASSGNHYGEVYYMAWSHASASVKSELELNCIQNLMQLFLELNRTSGTELQTSGKIIFKLLSYLHNNRNLVSFSVMLTRLYMPIIWRAAKSDHPIKRCNAAQLLFDVFPMEKPDANTAENQAYKDKQFMELMDLLKDECHYCRIVAIRGAARVMSDVMTSLSTEQWSKLLFTLADDLANDGSTPLVRREVFLALGQVVGSEKSAPLLAPILPHLTNHLHDVNERVRKAFVTMLFRIHESPHLNMTYTDVVPLSHIVARLSIEGEAVGSMLSKLLMPKFYYDDCNLKDMIARLQKMILMNQKASENLFRFSKSALNVQQIHLIIIAILAHLRKVVKEKLSNEQPNAENKGDKENIDGNSSDQSPMRKKTRRTSTPPSRRESVERMNSSQCPSESGSEAPNKKEVPSDQLIECHTGLLICVQVAWLTFYKDLSEPKNSELLENLYKLTVASVQSFLRYYKGTPAFYAAVSFSALVPIRKLSNETTVTTTCLSELRSAHLATPSNQLEAVIHALCEWNRGQDVIYLTLDWIDPAFKHFRLNQSVVQEAKGKRKTKVRFQPISGREVLGTKVLNILFSDFFNVKIVLTKQYGAALELFKYLEQVKIIIESKFSDPNSVGMITNDFLLDCLELVYKIAFALHKTESEDDKVPKSNEAASPAGSEIGTFSAIETFLELLDWAHRVVLPNLPSIVGDPEDIIASDTEMLFPLNLLSGLIKACIVAIQTDVTDLKLLKSSMVFVNKLLCSEWKFYFLNDGLNLIKAAGDYSEVWLSKDEGEIFSLMAPSVYSYCLMTIHETTPEVFAKFSISSKSIKKHILYLPLAALRIFGKENIRFCRVFDEVILSCIRAILADIRNVQAVDARLTFSEQPYIVNLLMMVFLSKPVLQNLLLGEIDKMIDDIKGDGSLVSVVSLMFTLVKWNVKGKLKSDDIKNTISKLRTKLETLSTQSEVEDSFYQTFEPHVEAKKLLEETADLAGCSLPTITVTRATELLPSAEATELVPSAEDAD